MENLSRSHHHQQNMVSKKTLYSNGATASKALYDDIFGGPPRFRATTLSPQVEDYNEIFGGFHSASRASSIPVLDLPVVHDEEEEVFFDVRSSLGFDYGEIFGGYTNGPDFALSFEELMMESNGACHGSSDDAWIPVDAEYLSEESDHSASNQCLSNGDFHESIDGNMEFNISYHKANQSTNEDMINGVTGVTQLLAVPGYSFMVDNSTSLPKTDPEGTDDGHLDIDFNGEMLIGRHRRKTVSHLSNRSASGPLFRSDVSSSRGYVRNGSFPNESFITISDLSLRTQPSQLPPPSRPPPPLDVKMRDSGRSTPNCDSVSSEGKSGESSPPYFDVEVDASSSAAASTAAIKEAMEKAQAKLKSAKELMDRKRDGFHSHIKSSSKNGRKGRDVGLTKDAHGYGRTKEEKVQDYYEGEDDIEFSIADERLNFANSTLSVPDSSEGGKNVNMAAKSSEANYRKESFSSQDSDKVSGAGEWKYDGQFFELVRMDESRMAFDQVNNENILVHNCIVERGKKEKKSTVEALKMQQANVKKVKAVRADYGLEEYLEKSKEACVWEENNGRLEVAEVAHRQKRVEKVQLAQEVCGRDESDKKVRINNHAVEYGKRQTRVEDPLQQGSMSEVQQSESTCGVKQTMKYKEKEQQTKANKTLEDQRSEMRHEEAFEKKEDEKKLEAASEHAQNERRVKEERKEIDKRREEREKKQKEACKREENEKRLREALECKENERKLKDTREKEDNDRILKDTPLKEENERRQKEVLEQEENSKREKEAHEREENEKRLKEAHEREENEKRLKEASEKENERRLREACERQENERKNQEALEMEENEKRIHENLEQEKIERHKDADEREESEKRCRDSFEKEQNGKRIIEESETEDTGKQLRGVYEEEENGKLRQPHEGDESETELTETCELEGVGDMSHEARNMEQTELRHPYYYEGDKLDGMNTVKEDYTPFSVSCMLDDEKNLRPSRLAGGCQGNGEKQEATEENARGQVQTKPTDMRENEKEAAFESANVQIFGKTGESTTMARGCFDHLQSRQENTRETACAYESVKKVAEAGLGIGHNNIDKIGGVPAMEYDIGNQGKKLAGGERGKVIMRSQVAFDQEGDRVNMMSNRIVRESINSVMKVDAVHPAVLLVKGSNQRTTQQVHESQSIERKVKTLNDNHLLEEKEAEKVKKEKMLEMERLRKMEEQREREREREKDRMAVDRAALEARERAYSESREKAECAAVERATAEARQRALNEARERLEKACAEAREKSLYDKPSIEVRLRAERAAVERATAEARERAFEKAMADRAACEVRVRIERSVSEKFSASSWNGGMRPSASSSDLQDQQLQASGSFTGSRYPYSAVNGSYHAERSEGVEGESAQRCKARLERHQRTAERAAKALAEKNMRDLLAQREQAERNRLAETLDADVKRWSSGKEGNLRALLSTLQYILGPDSGWHPVPLTEVITSAAVKRAYRKATLCVHPDKLQQRGATIQQKYVCEKVFDLLKEAWNKFNSEER